MNPGHELASIIIRHRKENIQKCSLRYVEIHEPLRCIFYRYPTDCTQGLLSLPSPSFLLHLDGEPLKRGIEGTCVLLDGTWRYSEVMYRMIPELHSLPKYSIPPGWQTAYPRRQADCSDPSRGLASIEALYIVHLITGKKTEGLLEGYYWKDEFLEKNKKLISNYI